MGMRWKGFRPAEGVMRAEGNDHLMTATIVRSLGVMLHYNHMRSSKAVTMSSLAEIYIPSWESDDMVFGVLTTNRTTFQFQRLTVGTQQELVTALTNLDDSGFFGVQAQRRYEYSF
jgi:hypothetical protein